MNEKNKLLTGSIGKTLIFFALPYLLSSFMQTFYGMADLFITGLYNGSATITAVSIGSQVMHMFTVILLGFAMGTTVRIGHAGRSRGRESGSQDHGDHRRIFHWICLCPDRDVVFAGRKYCPRYADSPGGGVSDCRLPAHLLFGNPLYHCLQRDQQPVSGGRRLPQPHVLCGGSLRGQYCP